MSAAKAGGRGVPPAGVIEIEAGEERAPIREGPHQTAGGDGIASALLLVKEHAVCWKKLVEVVEIPDIARQNRPSAFERLKVEARIVQQERPFAALDAEKARY